MFRECLLLACLAGFSYALIVCTPKYCEGVSCEELECEASQAVLQNRTFCGCCPACVTILKAGEECPTVRFIGGAPPTTICEEGLECIKGRCKDPSKCRSASTKSPSE